MVMRQWKTNMTFGMSKPFLGREEYNKLVDEETYHVKGDTLIPSPRISLNATR